MTLLLVLSLFGISGLFEGADPGSCPGSTERTTALVRQIRSEWPLRDSGDPVSGYVDLLGGRLIQAAGGAGGKTWRFDVVRNLAPNAFAVGEDYVVVTDGLFPYAGDESKLAAVIAHEMGHILEGHFCRKRQAADAEYRVGSLVQHYDGLAEEQADARAVTLLKEAGFDPGAMAAVLRCLAVDNPGFRAQLERRVKALERFATPSDRSPAFRDSAAFLKARRGVIADLQGLAPDGPRQVPGQTCR